MQDNKESSDPSLQAKSRGRTKSDDKSDSKTEADDEEVEEAIPKEVCSNIPNKQRHTHTHTETLFSSNLVVDDDGAVSVCLCRRSKVQSNAS